MALDLHQLRYLVAVGEEGHVTRAAERLGVQQPPLSQQIKAMEAQLGFQMFRLKPRGVELTESGRVLFEEARAIVARLEQAEREARRTTRGSMASFASASHRPRPSPCATPPRRCWPPGTTRPATRRA